MASTRVFVALNIFGLLILFQSNGVSSDYTSLINRLYKKAAAEDRPLIIVIDNKYLKENRDLDLNHHGLDLNHHAKHIGTPPRIDNHKMVGYKKSRLNRLLNTVPPIQPYQLAKLQGQVSSSDPMEYHSGLTPFKKRARMNKKHLRSPIIRNLLRISNDLNCEAQDECKDQCPPQKKHCQKTCEVKYVCDEESSEKDCDECDGNSCEDECGEMSVSTRGYTSTDPPFLCPEC